MFQSGVMAFIMTFSEKMTELDRLRQIFIDMDTSKDGRISMQELKECLNQVVGGVKANQSYFEEVLRGIDKDASNFVDYSEFLTASVSKVSLLTDQNLQTAFRMFDREGTGCITGDDLKRIFDTSGQKDQKVWSSIMEEVDGNKDGVISYKEFHDAMQKVLEADFGDLLLIKKIRQSFAKKIVQK